jgi:hypothetical protein
MARVILQCIICGNEIDPHSNKLHKLDPCGLHIVTNILEEDDDKRLEQAFYCHYDCIKGALANADYLNLEAM